MKRFTYVVLGVLIGLFLVGIAAATSEDLPVTATMTADSQAVTEDAVAMEATSAAAPSLKIERSITPTSHESEDSHGANVDATMSEASYLIFTVGASEDVTQLVLEVSLEQWSMKTKIVEPSFTVGQKLFFPASYGKYWGFQIIER